MNVSECYSLYAQMLSAVLPITLVIGGSNLIINMFLNAFFKGKLKFGGSV